MQSELESEFSTAHQLKELSSRIELPAFAISRGYREQQSTILAVELEHPTRGDHILATRHADESWKYRSVQDPNDRGDLLAFIRTRESKVPSETLAALRHYESERLRNLPPGDTEAHQLRLRFLEGRGITRETLDAPLFARNSRDGFHGRTGNPLGGDLWHTAPRPKEWGSEYVFRLRSVSPATSMVIATDTLTALSHYQLHRPQQAMYAALTARPNPNQGAKLETILGHELHYRGTVIVAVSKDSAGDDRFARDVQQVLARTRPDLELERHTPTVGRTWNEQLQLSRGHSISVGPATLANDANHRSPGHASPRIQPQPSCQTHNAERSAPPQPRVKQGLHR